MQEKDSERNKEVWIIEHGSIIERSQLVQLELGIKELSSHQGSFPPEWMRKK